MSEGLETTVSNGSVKMRHAASRFLYSYWDRIRAGRPAPERREVEPGEIGPILSDTFILEAVDDTYLYRLAGTHVCSLYGSELKATDWLAPWSDDDRSDIADLLSVVVGDAAGAAITFRGTNRRGQAVPVETVLLPLAHRGGFRRILGVTAPLDTPYWLGAQPVVKATAVSLEVIVPGGAESPAGLEPPAILHQTLATTEAGPQPARRLRHLTVYEGGRVD